MAAGSKAVRARNDVTYFRARLAFITTVLAALAELHLSLKKAFDDFDERGHPGRKPQRTKR